MSRVLWWRPPCLLRVVIVNMVHPNDAAIRGVLWRASGPWLTLRNADMLSSGVAATPLDGEVIVHRDNVAFLQVPPS